jgi:hypothetical protein
MGVLTWGVYPVCVWVYPVCVGGVYPVYVCVCVGGVYPVCECVWGGGCGRICEMGEQQPHKQQGVRHQQFDEEAAAGSTRPPNTS